jgi:hypothetical protein
VNGSWLSGEAPARRDGCRVLAVNGSADDQPRPSGRDKPGDRAGEPKNRSEASLPGLADWLLAAAAGLPTTVRLARSCSGAPVVDA